MWAFLLVCSLFIIRYQEYANDLIDRVDTRKPLIHHQLILALKMQNHTLQKDQLHPHLHQHQT